MGMRISSPPISHLRIFFVIYTAKNAHVARMLLEKKPPQYKEAHVALSNAIDLLGGAASDADISVSRSDIFIQRSICNLHMGKVCQYFLVSDCEANRDKYFIH